MLHTFNKSIQLYPALAAEHIMLSIAEWSPAAEVSCTSKYPLVIAPLDVSIFATSLLWTLYCWLLKRQNLKYIVYVRSDNSLPHNTLLSPKATGVKPVLWKTIQYNTLEKLFPGNTVSPLLEENTSYFSKSSFRHTHIHYLSFLNDVSVFPLVVSEDMLDNRFLDALRSLLWLREDTLFVLSDGFVFQLEEWDQTSHIISIPDLRSPLFDFFSIYCDKNKLIPSIMRVELFDKSFSNKTQTYQGILLA